MNELSELTNGEGRTCIDMAGIHITLSSFSIASHRFILTYPCSGGKGLPEILRIKDTKSELTLIPGSISS